MTITIGFASKAAAHEPLKKSAIWVMADTRLTFEQRRYWDSFIKTMAVGKRSAAVAAGNSNLFLTAIEAARPFIDAAARELEKNGRTMSVWAESTIIWAHLNLIFDDFANSQSRPSSLCIIVCGWLTDGSPAIVRLEREAAFAQVTVTCPAPGERAFVVAAAAEEKSIMMEALRRSAPPQGNSYHDVASVLWDTIKHQGEQHSTVGGGLALGYMNGDDNFFQWPLIDIEGQILLRGLRYPEKIFGIKPMEIQFNPALHDQLSRENAAAAFPNGESPTFLLKSLSDGIWIGDRRLVGIQYDDTWIIRELEERTNTAIAR